MRDRGSMKAIAILRKRRGPVKIAAHLLKRGITVIGIVESINRRGGDIQFIHFPPSSPGPTVNHWL